jgi:hypothetical protein
VIARCVRRAWLWCFDEYVGRDYSHRKEWVLERLAQLTSIFTIDICAYGSCLPSVVPDTLGIPYFPVGRNHYHLVVYVDQKRSKSLGRQDWTPNDGHINGGC